MFISWFFIRSGKSDIEANIYQGLLLLFLTLSMFEELLNNTGYIVKVLPISNFAEPFNFTRVIFGMKPVSSKGIQASLPENLEFIPQVVIDR